MNVFEKFSFILFGTNPRVTLKEGCNEFEAYTDLDTKDIVIETPKANLQTLPMIYTALAHENGHVLFSDRPTEVMKRYKDVWNVFEDMRIEKKLSEKFPYFKSAFPLLTYQLWLSVGSISPLFMLRVIGTKEYASEEFAPIFNRLTRKLRTVASQQDIEVIEDCIKTYNRGEYDEAIVKFVGHFYPNGYPESKGGESHNTTRYQGLSELRKENNFDFSLGDKVRELMEDMKVMADDLIRNSEEFKKFETSFLKNTLKVDKSKRSRYVHFTKKPITSGVLIAQGIRRKLGFREANFGLPVLSPSRGDIILRKKVRKDPGGLKFLLLIDISSSMASMEKELNTLVSTITHALELLGNKVAWILFYDTAVFVKDFGEKLYGLAEFKPLGGTSIRDALTMARAIDHDVAVVISDGYIGDLRALSSITKNKFLFGMDLDTSTFREVRDCFKRAYNITNLRTVMLALREIEKLIVSVS